MKLAIIDHLHPGLSGADTVKAGRQAFLEECECSGRFGLEAGGRSEESYHHDEQRD